MPKKYVPPPVTTGLGQVVNGKKAQQQRNFAMQPTQLSKGEQWLRDNPIPPSMGIVDELKSMLTPGNMTGANAIMDAFAAPGLSTTERITTGLTGVAQGIGFALGGASGKPAVQGIANTGLPARVVNKVRGETPLLHASPYPIQGKTINPTAGSAAMPDATVAFGWNPKAFLPNNPNGLMEAVTPYTGTLNSSGGRLKGTSRAPSQGGSIAVTKGKIRDNLVTDPNQNFMMATTSPQPVLKEFKMTDYIEGFKSGGAGKYNEAQLQADVMAALQRAGAKVKPNIVEKMLTKAEAAKIARRNRNEPSPV